MLTSLWQRTLTLEGHELKTVRGKTFTFVVATPDRIDVSPEDGNPEKPVQIYSREFGIAEQHIEDFATVRPSDLTKVGVSRVPTYVAGITRALANRVSCKS